MLGLGYGMVPEMQVRKQLNTAQLLCLIPDAHTDVHLYWHHWKQQSEPLKMLTSVILAHTQEIFIQNLEKPSAMAALFN